MYKTNELQNLESGLYSATNEDGKMIYVCRQVGSGWSVYTPTHDGWHEVVDYDEAGEQECVRYTKNIGF